MIEVNLNQTIKAAKTMSADDIVKAIREYKKTIAVLRSGLYAYELELSQRLDVSNDT